mgnify:CR=1 FL=1
MSEREFTYILDKTARSGFDGGATIWITADKAFTDKEAESKIMDAAALLPKCKVILTAAQDPMTLIQDNGKKIAVGEPKLVEFVTSPDCVDELLAHLKKKWGGKWTPQEVCEDTFNGKK